MKPYTIHKPHYELLDFKGTRRGVLQERGDYVVANLVTGERGYCVESCARHLTNYGRGTQAAPDKAQLMSALRFMFGDAAPRDVICRKLA